MSLLRALATELTTRGVANYSDFGTSDVFLGILPDTQDALIGLFTLNGTADLSPDSDSDEMRVRIVVRGARDDVLSAEERAAAVYRALRDSGPQTWGDLADRGVRVARVTSSPPYDTGIDRLGRISYVILANVRYHLG